MYTVIDKLNKINDETKQDIRDAIEYQGVTVTDETPFEDYPVLVDQIDEVYLSKMQTKTIVPSDVDVEIVPDDDYIAFAKIIIEEALNVKPCNIREGITMFGIQGTMKSASLSTPPFVSDDPDNPDPGTIEDAEREYENQTGETTPDDMFLLVDNNGNRTYAYLTDNFNITSYNFTTTEFTATGWRRLSYHTTGELAGTWSYDDFTTTASTGWNYLKYIITCTRDKLYYKGFEVWPHGNNTFGEVIAVSTLGTALPWGMSALNGAAIDNKIYLLGGNCPHVFIFDCETETLEQQSDVFSKSIWRTHPIAIGRKIYVFGGSTDPNSTAFGDIYAYDVDTGVLETKTATAPNRFCMACQQFGDYVYIFGGAASTSATVMSNQILKYRISTDTIETLPVTLKYPVVEACSARYGSKIFIAGGWTGSAVLSTIQVFDIETETVSVLENVLPEARHAVGCTVVGSQMYIVGGSDGSYSKKTIIRFDMETYDAEITPFVLPDVRQYGGVVSCGSNIFVFGGLNKNSNTFCTNIYKLSLIPKTNIILDLTPLLAQGGLRNEAADGYVLANSDRVRVGRTEVGISCVVEVGKNVGVNIHAPKTVGWNAWCITSTGAEKIAALSGNLINDTDFLCSDTDWSASDYVFTVPEDTQYFWFVFRDMNSNSISPSNFYSAVFYEIQT